ncbi:MAG: N-acetylglucosamine-6-phosphate deacetylase [Clostridia bacterium]|nr:N-acetylglucosamine-6-phosphate deacetylase [Clostridia bacterium]
MIIEAAHVFDTEKRKFMEKKISIENGVFAGVSLSDGGDDAYVIPGLIDVHTHGRCGYDIMECDEAELSALSVEYAKSGATTVFPTVMTAPIKKVTEAIKRVANTNPAGARFCGVHVEGPFISEMKPGCHNVSDITAPSESVLSSMIRDASPLRVHFTIAPEKCADGLIRSVSRSATIGIGHTAANYETAMRAVNSGARSFTHTFNAMSPLSHREPGVVGAALESDAYAEFICDGFHIAPDVISLAYRAKRNAEDKFVLITDSLSVAGLPDGEYVMNGINFTLSGQSALRADGVIVGSVIDMLSSVKNLARFAGISFEEALICATKNPAKMVGIYDKVGSIEVGKCADFVVLDNKMNIISVYVGGKKIV